MWAVSPYYLRHLRAAEKTPGPPSDAQWREKANRAEMRNVIPARPRGLASMGARRWRGAAFPGENMSL
jgi:hypothetical protein